MQFALVVLFLPGCGRIEATFESGVRLSPNHDIAGASARPACPPERGNPSSVHHSDEEACAPPATQAVSLRWTIKREAYGLAQSPVEWVRLVASGLFEQGVVSRSGAASFGSFPRMVLLTIACAIPVLNMEKRSLKVLVSPLVFLHSHMSPVPASWVDDVHITLPVWGLLDMDLECLIMCAGDLVWAISRCWAKSPPPTPLPDAPDQPADEADAPDDMPDIERAFQVSSPRDRDATVHLYRSKDELLTIFPVCRARSRGWDNLETLDPEPGA